MYIVSKLSLFAFFVLYPLQHIVERLPSSEITLDKYFNKFVKIYSLRLQLFPKSLHSYASMCLTQSQPMSSHLNSPEFQLLLSGLCINH